jgi:hypothetical protein
VAENSTGGPNTFSIAPAVDKPMKLPLALLAVLVAGPLAGCLTEEAKPDDVQLPPPGTTLSKLQPAAGNNVLYLHSSDSKLWMDTEAGTASTGVRASGTTLDEPVWHRFPLEPAPELAVELSTTTATLRFEATLRSVVGASPEVRVRYVQGGAVYPANAAAVSSGSIEVTLPPVIPAGSSVALEVCICPRDATLSYAYELKTDGSSRLEMAIASPTFRGTAQAVAGHLAGEAYSPIETGRHSDGTYWARQRVSWNGGLDATRLSLDFSTRNGDVELDAQSSGYDLAVHLEARAPSEQAARERLTALQVVGELARDGQATRIGVHVTAEDWNNLQASITASVKAIRLESLQATTTNGLVRALGHVGGAWTLQASNGGVRAAGEAQSLDMATTNADVQAAGRFGHVNASSTNGGIALELEANRHGTWSAKTTNGNIMLHAPEDSSRGYDLLGKTTNGQVHIGFRETQPVGAQSQQERHERTAGFDGRSIRTVVQLETTNGMISAAST